ncbi:MAG TPA: tetratricopeptide repeat protein [Syntrophales bacterium]|nr:tetratricopeptide repeat protein [Syntrophales bacterium]
MHDPAIRKVAIPLLLALVVLTVFWQVQTFKLVRYDDNFYVAENRHVLSGLTGENIRWAFTNAEAGFWHPLTWLSLMLDYEFHGFQAGGYHRTNVLLHLASVLLLFFVLTRMTGALWKSAFVAALFALHPLQVEPVAWVSQRKDMLSTFFAVLTLYLYCRYAERPGAIRYLYVVFFYILGLMSKPMIVTLPFAMLLLDYWPLRRFPGGKTCERQGAEDGVAGSGRFPARSLPDLLYEKVPLIILACLASALVFFTERSVGALSSFAAVPLDARIANALVSYVSYVQKMIWPSGLAFFYPHPVVIPPWKWVPSLFALAAITFLAVRTRRQRPYLFTGWLWYLGTLLPVIGVIQVGPHAMADRYAYIPMIGLSLAVAWGGADLAARVRAGRAVAAAAALIALASLSAAAWIQTATWRDSYSLFGHALQVTENNYIAHNNLGLAYYHDGRFEEAVREYRAAIAINPNHAFIYNNLGAALIHVEKYEEAVFFLSEAIRRGPGDGGAHHNMGSALFHLGRYGEAVLHYRKAIALGPQNAGVHYSLGLTLLRLNRPSEAEAAFRAALKIEPGHEGAGQQLDLLGGKR